jgi:anti-sigma B factor antagonist
MPAFRHEGREHYAPASPMPEPELVIQRRETEGAVTFTISGEVDLVNSTRLKRAFDDELDRRPARPEIRADLAAVDFMDTTGVAVLLHARARAVKHGTRFVVTSASPFLDRLFEITGIAPLIR